MNRTLTLARACLAREVDVKLHPDQHERGVIGGRHDYELHDEYDLSEMTVVADGRYAPHRWVGKNVFVLAPDVAQAFPADEAVNEALRLVLQIAEVPNKYATETAETLPRP